MEHLQKKVSQAQHISPRRRQPLGDGNSAANVQPANLARADESPMKPQSALPKSESITPDGISYVVRYDRPSPPKNQRMSQISSEAAESKRNSAISTTSSNTSGYAKQLKRDIGPWRLGGTVGAGGSGVVRKVRHNKTGQTAVAKIVPVAKAEQARAMSLANLVQQANRGDVTLQFENAMPLGLEREVAIMKLLKHPNIVRLYDVWENRSEIYLIMEYVKGGELFEYVAEHTRLAEDVTVYLFRQMVWALKYCHSLNIHHRDLKPENILLDFDTMRVKLVDFGMAALQPKNDLLTTPCGSPHYAAPELLVNRPYDGSQADVWSIGVVLFVMLAGFPPFNFPMDRAGVVPDDHKLRALFSTISRADYQMPRAFSAEAQDLIRRIFVVNPKQRITISEILVHPFIHKYDNAWHEASMPVSDSLKELLLAQEEWRPLKKRHIDRDIFRALRTLWHGESDTALVRKLCSPEFNQEKLFYHTMLNHSAENSNLQKANSFRTSASDHHHHAKMAVPIPPIPSKASECDDLPVFTITNNEHLFSKHSYHDLTARSDASYDPFRSSRSPVVPVPKSSANINVHPRSSIANRRQSLRSSRAGNSLRVDVLRGNSRRSAGSRGSSLRSSASTTARRTVGKRSSRSSSSRVSMASSHLLNGSPMPIMRPSEVHKRGVQFSHSRKSSAGSALHSRHGSETHTPEQLAKSLRQQVMMANERDSSFVSPAGEPVAVVRSKKGGAVHPTPRTRKFKEHADVEARKVSVELGKACDEAFWRSSVSSEMGSSMADPTTMETPPSSVSPWSRFSPGEKMSRTPISSSIRNRPLPPTPLGTRSTLHPLETPSTYTARELAEMRDRLAAKYALEGTGDQKNFHDVLRQLEQLMRAAGRSEASAEARRVTAIPSDCNYLTTSVDLNSLDVIPEEGRFADAEGSNPADVGVDDLLLRRGVGARRQPGNAPVTDKTIRVVAPSPPTTTTSHAWPPLNIRKPSTTVHAPSRYTRRKKLSNMADHQSNTFAGASNDHQPAQTVDWNQMVQEQDAPEREQVRSISMHPLDDTSAGAIKDGQFPPKLKHVGKFKFSSRPDSFAGDNYPYGPIIGEPSNPHAPRYDGLDDRPGSRDERQRRLQAAQADPYLGRIEEQPEVGSVHEQVQDEPKKRMGFFDKFRKTKVDKGKQRAVGPDGSVNDADSESGREENRMGGVTTTITGGHKVKAHLNAKHQRNVKGYTSLGQYRLGQFKFDKRPAMVVLAAVGERTVVWNSLKIYLNFEAGSFVEEASPATFRLTCSYEKKTLAVMKLKVRYDLEVFPLSANGHHVPYSVMRMVQLKGSPVALYDLGAMVTRRLLGLNMLVTDENQQQAMKTALFRGLDRADAPLSHKEQRDKREYLEAENSGVEAWTPVTKRPKKKGANAPVAGPSNTKATSSSAKQASSSSRAFAPDGSFRSSSGDNLPNSIQTGPPEEDYEGFPESSFAPGLGRYPGVIQPRDQPDSYDMMCAPQAWEYYDCIGRLIWSPRWKKTGRARLEGLEGQQRSPVAVYNHNDWKSAQPAATRARDRQLTRKDTLRPRDFNP